MVMVTLGCAGNQPASSTDDADATTSPAPDASAPGADGGSPAGGNPLLPRVENTTCQLPEAPPVSDLALEPLWPDQTFDRPVWFGVAPGRPDARFVVEQGGRILLVPSAGPTGAKVFMSRAVSRAGNEEGLLGLAFHPRFAENGRLFTYYSAASPRRSVLSEWRVAPEAPDQVDARSERILMEVMEPYANHNGGDLRFGPDGHLYVGLGDGGSGGDPHGNGQRPDTVLGSILRIDVDTEDAACALPYGIPPDNPFAEGRCVPGTAPQGEPEVWAWGLRNPWRFSFDRSTGALWAADVGQDRYEEVDVVEGGQNYGWNEVEGDTCYRDGCDRSAFAAPVYVYDHSEGRSITGGFVYRGPSLPELWGAYVFGDYASGRLYALWRREGQPASVKLLADTDRTITAFGEDHDGELYVVSFNGGIDRLVRRAPPAGARPIPERLSQTGCFADAAGHVLAAGVVPYTVNTPLWSDGAEKLRAFALPAGGTITYRDDDGWVFPVGAVLLKTFVLGERRLETRLLRRGATGWTGYAYRWNPEQTDASLLPGPVDEAVMGPEGPQPWHYPSRAECDQCHTAPAGVTLGLSTRQLNGPMTYGDRAPYPQLEALAGAGYVALPGPAADLPSFPAPDDADADVEARARALLDANCSMCHRPNGTANARIDLRATTPLAETGLCDQPPQQGDLGLVDARLVAAGDPARSVLLARVSRRGDEQMPPLGTARVDAHGVTLIGAWIQGLAGCP